MLAACGLSVRDIEDAFKDESAPAIDVEDGGIANWGSGCGMIIRRSPNET